MSREPIAAAVAPAGPRGAAGVRTLRRVRQPGPPAPERVVAVPAGAVAVEAELPAGTTLLDGLHGLLRRLGAESACLQLEGGALAPFAYVIPALSPDGSQAAFYSGVFRPEGPSRLQAAAATVGFRDGAPFFHCHALWTEADGRRGCGHVLPEGTVVAAPVRVRGAGLVGARFAVAPDGETGFSLFGPVATGTAPPRGAAPALALRLAPNQDLCEALDGAARGAGWAEAAVAGGVASIIGARFADAPPVEGFATELLVRRGLVRPEGEGGGLDIAIVDLHGTVGEGRLAPGENPVLMTFEGALVAAG